MDEPIYVPNDIVEQARDIDNMDNSGSDVVDVLDELEMPEGGDDAIDLDEIDSDSSFLHDHLSTHATTENVMGHEPSDVPKKCAIAKTVMDFDDIDALDRL